MRNDGGFSVHGSSDVADASLDFAQGEWDEQRRANTIADDGAIMLKRMGAKPAEVRAWLELDVIGQANALPSIDDDYREWQRKPPGQLGLGLEL